MISIVLANATFPDGKRADVHIDGDRIAAFARVGTPSPDGAERIDLGDALLTPAMVDGHIHLDKTLLGLPFQAHRAGDTVAERIAREKELRREIRYSVENRARRLIEIGADELAPILGVELRGHAGRPDEIAEHHRDRTALRVIAGGRR